MSDPGFFSKLLVATIFAGFGAVALGERVPGRGLRLALAGAVLAFCAARAGTVDLLMLMDSRYAAEDWVREQLSDRSRIVVLGKYRELAPRIRPVLPWEPVIRLWDRQLRRMSADYLVWNADEARLLGIEDWGLLLEDGSVDYRLAARHGWRLPIDLLRMGKLRPVNRDEPFERSIRTNLKAINPEIVTVVRSWEIDRMEALDAIAKLWRGEAGNWEALGDALVSSLRLAPRRTLAKDTVAFGLNKDGWTYGDRPAAVVVSNQGEAPIVPVLGLRSGESSAADSRVFLRWMDGEEELRVGGGTESLFTLPELLPRRRLLVLVASETVWSPSQFPESELGVAIRRVR